MGRGRGSRHLRERGRGSVLHRRSGSVGRPSRSRSVGGGVGSGRRGRPRDVVSPRGELGFGSRRGSPVPFDHSSPGCPRIQGSSSLSRHASPFSRSRVPVGPHFHTPRSPLGGVGDCSGGPGEPSSVEGRRTRAGSGSGCRSCLGPAVVVSSPSVSARCVSPSCLTRSGRGSPLGTSPGGSPRVDRCHDLDGSVCGWPAGSGSHWRSRSRSPSLIDRSFREISFYEGSLKILVLGPWPRPARTEPDGGTGRGRGTLPGETPVN